MFFYSIFVVVYNLQKRGHNMAKTTYDYSYPAVPLEAIELIDKKYREARGRGEKVRKADLWIDGAKKARAKP